VPGRRGVRPAIIIEVIMNVAAVGLLLVASQSVSEPVGG